MSMNAARVDESMTLTDFYRESGVSSTTAFADNITLAADRLPMEHQVNNLHTMLANGSWGLYDDPGTAKTLPTQAWAMYWMGHGYRVLCLMPPVLLNQFRSEMWRNFEGSRDAFTSHILREGPIPARITKRRVQQVLAYIHTGQPLKEQPPKVVLEHVAKMRTAEDLPFTRTQVEQIRASKDTAKNLAKRLYCTPHAITNIRKNRFREDLFAEWEADDSWPQMLMLSYQMFLREYSNITGKYKVLVADEAHALCHPSSDTHKRVRSFMKQDHGNTAAVLLTGTPIPNVPSDAYGLIKLTNPDAYANYDQFKSIHCITEQGRVWDKVRERERRFELVVGYKNLELLHQRLFAKGSRITKEQVFDLDAPIIVQRDVDLADEHYELYRKLLRERVLEVKGETISATEASGLRMKAMRLVTNPDEFSSKPIKQNEVRESVAELLDEIGCKHHEKVVIFGIFNNSIDAMAEWFKDYNPALVYGKSNTAKNVKKFLEDDTCRLMIAHPQSGGVGLNLQAVCRYVIFAEPFSVPGWFKQASERVWRKGQDKVCTFYIMNAPGTIWPKVLDKMREKTVDQQQVVLDKRALLVEMGIED